MNTKLAEMTIL